MNNFRISREFAQNIHYARISQPISRRALNNPLTATELIRSAAPPQERMTYGGIFEPLCQDWKIIIRDNISVMRKIVIFATSFPSFSSLL